MENEICNKCGGTGWVLAETGKGGPVARRCSCFSEKRKQSLMEQANIPMRYRDCRLENYAPQRNNESQWAALKISKKFADDFPAVKVGLIFIGPCGVGKTHLAVSIIQDLVLKKGISCLFYDFRELIKEIQGTFTPESALTETAVLGPVFDCDVLVLDELGAKRTTAWVEETVFYIINQRYNQNKITIFTTNYPDTQEAEDNRDSFYKKDGESLQSRIGVRLRSRIYEMCKVVEIGGEDFRKNVKQANYRF